MAALQQFSMNCGTQIILSSPFFPMTCLGVRFGKLTWTLEVVINCQFWYIIPNYSVLIKLPHSHHHLANVNSYWKAYDNGHHWKLCFHSVSNVGRHYKTGSCADWPLKNWWRIPGAMVQPSQSRTALGSFRASRIVWRSASDSLTYAS